MSPYLAFLPAEPQPDHSFSVAPPHLLAMSGGRPLIEIWCFLHLAIIHTAYRSRRRTVDVSTKGICMSRRSSKSVQLFLVAALFGFSALLLAGAAQRSSIGDQHLFRANAPALTIIRSAALPGRETVLPGHSRYGSHALPRWFTPTPLLAALHIVAPEFSASVPAPEVASSLAAAPRTTGPSRAPPAA